MPLGDAWGNSWLNSWGNSWLRSTTPTAEVPPPAGGKGDNERPRRQIFKPTGLPPFREGRKTVEERVEEARQIHEEVSKEVSEEVSQEVQEKTLTAKYVARMSLPDIEAEIGRILRKKVITEEDEVLLLLLMVTTVAG